jgi:S-adenosylmethionine synthetase
MMSNNINIQCLNRQSEIEMAERKGIGHPDTICDNIAEEVSIALSRYYLEAFGSVLHHNVDKALLVGGKSLPAYGGGTIIQPMELYIAGRATDEVKGKKIPVDEIAIHTAKDWLQKNMRFLDPEKHLIIIPKIRSGSNELVELFQRFSKGEVPLANDTSFGVG